MALYDRSKLLYQEAQKEQVCTRRRAFVEWHGFRSCGPREPPSERPDHIVSAKELGNYLHKAVQSLDPMYREVLLLRDGEGLSAPEVAEILGIGVDAVKSRLHRARLAVRDQMAPLLGVLPKPAPAFPRNCPDVLTLFSRHLENEIDPEICKTMELHLAECSGCRDDCESLKKTLALCKVPQTFPFRCRCRNRSARRFEPFFVNTRFPTHSETVA